MRIEKLTRESCEAYVAFRKRMWPIHDGAGSWEVVLHKYFANPRAEICEESGLYACMDNGDICGVMGAYPMPVTVNGCVHPGHMLVDWAVLPEYQSKPVGAVLYGTLVNLPGRKFASYGTPTSQRALGRAGIRIPAVVGAAIIQPIKAAALQLYLRNNAQPSPTAAEKFCLASKAQTVGTEELEAATPRQAVDTAFVHSGPEFWKSYFECRAFNGAFALKLEHKGEVGRVVLTILESGTVRFATLLAFRPENPTVSSAKALGQAMRAALRKLGVCVLIATEADDLWRAFLSSVGFYVARKPVHWWAIPKKSDAFAPDSVRWWFTSAERDSIWAPGALTTSMQS